MRGALVMDQGALTWPPPPPPPPSPAAQQAAAEAAKAAADKAKADAAAAALPKDKWGEQLSSSVNMALASAAALALSALAPTWAFLGMLTKFSLASICGETTRPRSGGA